MSEKLQKIMSRAGLGSRRQSEEVIAAGRVRVNGEVARLGDRADQNKDKIEVDGRLLEFSDKIYIKLYKPKGVLSSTEDELEQERPTVRDMVDLPGHLYPVGRLDKQSEGLMLLTNDGKLTHRLTHPRFGHHKVYRVAVEGRPPLAVIQQWREGVELDGKMTAPAEIEVVHQQKDHTWLRITMREGRKRQIRRVATLLGFTINKLIREEIGPIQLGTLRPGQWQHLSDQEVKALNQTIRRDKGRPSGKRPAAKAPPAKAPSGRTQSDKRPSSKRPSGKTQSDKRPSSKRPSGKTQSDKRPSGKRPSNRRDSNSRRGRES